MIRIIAKGSREDVKSLAHKHGVKGLRMKKELTNCNEIVASCPYNRDNYNAVSQWFHDPDTGYTAPFTPGACLYYWAE